MSHYPAELGFTTYLTHQGLSPATVASYGKTIQQLITFLAANRPRAVADALNNVNTNDLRAYFSYLQDERHITINTYNKTLAQLNRYFTYLFENQLISNYPTLPLHGRAVKAKPTVHPGEWLSKLPRILADDQVSFYTRLTLLLLAHGFTVGEFLHPGFWKTWADVQPIIPGEQHFREAFAAFHQPLASRQQCPDLFLKQRINLQAPLLGNPALHKYLKADESYLCLKLNPAQLHQDYVLTNLSAMDGQSNNDIMAKLHLDPASLLYYQRLRAQRQQ